MASPFTPATVPGSPFNGGTVTQTLAVTLADVNDRALDLSAPAQASNDLIRARGSTTDGYSQFLVDQDNNVFIYSGSDGGQEAKLQLLDNTTDNNGTIVLDTFAGVTIHIEASAQTALLITPGGAHTGDSLRILGTDAAESVVVDAVGHLRILRHAAPTDASLVAGECALWFDQTDGAGNTKLMLKGKSADGTVKTAAIALA